MNARRPILSVAGRFWLLTLAALLGAALTLRLGFWQLSRAAQKEAAQATIMARAQLPALNAADLAQADGQFDALLQRHMVVTGTWDTGHTVYLDNRQMDARQGFYVVTPLLVDGGKQVILVQRGWLPRDFTDRTRLVPFQTPTGPVQIKGRLAPWPSKLYEFGAAVPGSIRQNLDLAEFRAETKLPLPAVTLVQLEGDNDGLLRHWPEADLGLARHYGYAAQWFALCALITILYVWFQIVRRNRTAPRP